MDHIKDSILVKYQLPEYIREDFNNLNFLEFLKNYYIWLETTYPLKNLNNFYDIDSTLDEFVEHFKNTYLLNFPNTIVDDKKLIKFSKQFYQNKGNIDSYKFLFKIFFNSKCEISDTGNYLFKPSSGKWIQPTYILLNTTDEKFLSIKNYKILGLKSKSIANIDKCVQDFKYIKLYISNIIRKFVPGEQILIIDETLKPVIIDGNELFSEIVGNINSIEVNKEYKGTNYKINDPVVIFNGLNVDNPNSVCAEAVVSDISKGQIKNIIIEDGSYGFRTYPNSKVNILNGTGSLRIDIVDTSNPDLVNYIVKNTISSKKLIKLSANNFNFGNTLSNINSKLIDCFTFDTFNTFPISHILSLDTQNFNSSPIIVPESLYNTDTNTKDLKSLGILGPIQIINSGINYSNNDTISFVGGDGFGAYAKISVNENGEIINAEYINNSNNIFCLGGNGYTSKNLPKIVINSLTGTDANLVVTTILGDSAKISATYDSIGAINSIKVVNNGNDYISNPSASLRILDINVENVSNNIVNYCFQKDSFNNYIFYANVYKNLTNSSIRLFDYYGTLNIANPLIFGNDSIKVLSTKYYGDGLAKANVLFNSGINYDKGYYLNDIGKPSQSAFLQGKKYNDYTYEISSNVEVSKYKKLLKSLIHAAGTKFVGKCVIESNVEMSNINISQSNTYIEFNYNLLCNKNNTIKLLNSNTFSIINDDYYIENIDIIDDYKTITLDSNDYGFDNQANINTTLINSLSFIEYNNYNISNYINVNDILILSDLNIYFKIVNIDNSNNLLYTTESIFNTYPNCFYGYANSNNLYVLEFSENFKNLNIDIDNILTPNDYISHNNINYLVKTIDYGNNIIILYDNLNCNNEIISINRNIISNNILIRKQV